MKFTIYLPDPFSLQSVIRSHGWAQLLPFETDDSYTKLSYVQYLKPSQVIKFTIQDSESGIEVSTDTELSTDQITLLRTDVNWMLACDLEVNEFYDLADSEPKLAHVRERALGRILRSPTLFEDVVKTLFTTNTMWSATRKMAERLVQNYGDPLPSDPSIKTFPSPDRVAEVSPAELKKVLRIGYRAPYLSELAIRTATGDLDLESFKTSSLSTLELKKELRTIKGIGDYAASAILMILGRYDYLPVDSWAFKMVSKEFYKGNPVTQKDIEAVFEKWGHWKGLAYWFWKWSEEG